jgi:uncharacterized protein YggU (UPF0235/DUF167 family)
MAVRFPIRVRPGSARSGVGGAYGAYGPETDSPALVVRVTEQAVDGRATAAALRAVAKAFGVRQADVRLVSGATSRTKVIEVTGADPDRLEELLRG